MTHEEILKEAQRVSKEALDRINQLNEAIKKNNAVLEDIRKERAALDSEKRTIEAMNKRVKYMKLRLDKVIAENSLDDSIKKLILEATDEKIS